MEAQTHNSPPYEDYYKPPFELVTEEECETILIYLPGYKIHQLQVLLTPSRILKISGERPSGDKKRFNKEFLVPANCHTKGITAKYEGGILYVRQPKFLDKDGEDMCAFKPSSRLVTACSGLFRELRKPENLMVFSVLLVLNIGFCTTLMLKSFVGGDKE